MCRTQLIVVLTCALGAVDADIKPDWDKLTDFSAKFTNHGENERGDPRPPAVQFARMKSISGDGSINVDVFGARGFLKADDTIITYDGTKIPFGAELYFDGPNRHVAIKMYGTIPQPPVGDFVLEPSCVDVKFPAGLLPPGDMLKDQFKQNEPNVAAYLNQLAEHGVRVTMDGQPVTVVSACPQCAVDTAEGTYFGYHDDATPAGVAFDAPKAGAEWNPDLKFTQWNQGAHIPNDADYKCTEMTPAEALAKPYAKQSLRNLDRVMAIARRMKPLQQALQHFPAKPSLLLEGAAGTSRSVQSSTPVMLPTMVVAFAAGTLASLLVFAVLKPRQPLRTPLLDSVA